MRKNNALKNIRKKLTKIEMHKIRLEYLRRSIDNIDWKYYDSFFEDKEITVILERFAGHEKDWDGYAQVDLDTTPNLLIIGINECIYDELDKVEGRAKHKFISQIDETLAHEMLHLFIFCASPTGRKVFGDKCKPFRELKTHYCRKS